jgi:hypothetical protein
MVSSLFRAGVEPALFFSRRVSFFSASQTWKAEHFFRNGAQTRQDTSPQNGDLLTQNYSVSISAEPGGWAFELDM